MHVGDEKSVNEGAPIVEVSVSQGVVSVDYALLDAEGESTKRFAV